MCPVDPLRFDTILMTVARNVGKIFANLGRVWSVIIKVAMLIDVHSAVNYVLVRLLIATRLSSSTKLQRRREGV